MGQRMAPRPTALRGAQASWLPWPEGEFETVNDALGSCWWHAGHGIDDAAGLEQRADQLARRQRLRRRALGLALGLVLTGVAWRSLSDATPR